MTTHPTTSVRDLCAPAQAHEDAKHIPPVQLSPQMQTILDHLKDRRTHGLSQYEASNLYRIAALPRRVADLIDRGFAIRKERRTDITDRAYTRYFLATDGDA